jgi:DNA-binding NtrC family response regulator
MAIDEEMVFTGESAAVTRLRLQVARVAPHFRVALLVGEVGTGVEAVARRMHSLSPAASGEFVSLSAEKFASGAAFVPAGVLFLHGLEVLDPAAQGEFLRRLHGIARETRVLVATAADPRGMVATGRLRAEVYERVGTLELRVAQLRERIGDLPALLGADVRFGERALDRMRRYAWPGNLLELAQVKARVSGLGRVVEPDDLELADSVAEKAVRLDEVIERHVVQVLERVGGNKLRAAEMLGISRSTLYRMLEGVGV